jgi:hypothetical protein
MNLSERQALFFPFSWLLLVLGSITCIIVLLFNLTYRRRVKQAAKEQQRIA